MAQIAGLELKLGSMMLMSDTCPSLIGASWGHRTAKSGGSLSDSEVLCGPSGFSMWLGLLVSLSLSLGAISQWTVGPKAWLEHRFPFVGREKVNR